MALIRGRANGEVSADRKATVLPVTRGLEASKASMSVGGCEMDAAGVLQSFCEVGFGAKGVYGGVDLTQLVFKLAIADDVGSEPPIAKFVCSIVQVSVAGCTPLQKSKEPRTHWFSREGEVFSGTSEKFVSVCGFSLAKASSNSPYLFAIVFISFDKLRG